MNKKILELGVKSGLLISSDNEDDYYHQISSEAEIDDVVEFAHLIISDAIKSIKKSTHGFDLSDRGVALKQAQRTIYSYFYGNKT